MVTLPLKGITLSYYYTYSNAQICCLLTETRYVVIPCIFSSSFLRTHQDVFMDAPNYSSKLGYQAFITPYKAVEDPADFCIPISST